MQAYVYFIVYYALRNTEVLNSELHGKGTFVENKNFYSLMGLMGLVTIRQRKSITTEN